MKSFNGTPGPWVASKTDRSIGPVSRDDDQSYGMILPVAWVEFNGDDACRLADASLIAAAPDLLEALDKLTKEYIFTRGQLNDDTEEELADVLCIKNARAAISKALGEV
ncbi:hypothetical protein RIU82_09225 [Enterobacter soli]|nr:hypothetical protein [Enterobacter soli]